ncbi:MAG TPA: molybdopterin-dependent oxidoreductase [Steroidobacteraceae bacterium]|nr:molybdopterin-dependent oxidoreductase [Steroidobacteraceae bacterium]
MIARRQVIAAGIGSLAAAFATRVRAGVPPELGQQPPNLPEGARTSAELVRIDGKLPLIKRTYRPPNFETPLKYFAEPITRNDAFFVRYHAAAIPEVNAGDWRLTVAGDGASAQASFSLAELQQRFTQVDVTAVCLCSGNRRGMFEPHVPGIQWGPGAMGNARWSGVRLRDVLNAVGVRKEALEVSFDGADSALLTGPDFVKSIPLWKALEADALIAFGMNGEPLPHWNGFPARLVVPGWTATYWVKHLARIDVLTQPSASFWMRTGYRIPANRFPVTERFVSQEAGGTTPITEIAVSSLIVEPADGMRLAAGRGLEVRGIAWDGGAGIARVEYSLDGGATWRRADLGADFGRFSFRPWKIGLSPRERGPLALQVRATNRLGVSQPEELIRNPAGYHHNIIQRIVIEVV